MPVDLTNYKTNTTTVLSHYKANMPGVLTHYKVDMPGGDCNDCCL